MPTRGTPTTVAYVAGRYAAKHAMLSEHGYTREEAHRMAQRVRPAKGAPLSEFQRGLNVELEHRNVTGGGDKMTAQIANAHLKEDPRYYSKLRKLEGG